MKQPASWHGLINLSDVEDLCLQKETLTPLFYLKPKSFIASAPLTRYTSTDPLVLAGFLNNYVGTESTTLPLRSIDTSKWPIGHR